MATLGVMYMVRGVALLMTNGLTYNNLGGRPDLGNTGFDWLGFNRLAGVPIGVVVMVVIAMLGSLSADPHALRALALRLGRQRSGGGTVGRPGQDRADFGLHAVRRLRRDRRPDPLLAAHVRGTDRGHHLRAHRHRGRRDRGCGPHGWPRQYPGHPARRLRDRLSVRWSRDHRHLVLLADSLHRRRHRVRGVAQRHPVSPPRQAPERDRRPPPLPR